jgi:FMN phosphatase YigB (HAD superfamily)
VIKMPSGPTAYFDVDDTLVTTADEEGPNTFWISVPGKTHRGLFRAIQSHIDAMKAHKVRGHTVVVWSQGESDWAEAVVKTLGLEPYVDYILNKPHWYFDDLEPHEFMDRRIYYGLGEE